MAAFKFLLFQSRRRCCFSSQPPPSSRLAFLLRRLLSSESDPSAPPPPTSDVPSSNIRKPIPLQPVSYPTKPKSPPSPETQSESLSEQQIPRQDAKNFGNPESRSWTRDEMRYMKDVSVISPISYPSKVAPLPEDRVKLEEEERGDRSEELERERRRIDYEKWNAMRRTGVLRNREEEENLPFPMLIKADSSESNSKKKVKVIYDLKEAIQIIKSNTKKTFDETLEAHVKMTSDLRRTDLKLSGFVRLPHGFGKTYRVAVFAEGAAADEARSAGADVVGGPELVENIRTGELKMDFDKCIATPSMMEHVKKLSRYLKQLMPDAKKGMVTNDISRAVKDAKEQSVLFKKDKTAIVHVGLGKLSFSEDALRTNVGAFVNALLLAKPTGLKKSSKYAGYVDSFHVCSTMGRSYPISIQSLSMAADRYNRSQLQ